MSIGLGLGGLVAVPKVLRQANPKGLFPEKLPVPTLQRTANNKKFSGRSNRTNFDFRSSCFLGDGKHDYRMERQPYCCHCFCLRIHEVTSGEGVDPVT